MLDNQDLRTVPRPGSVANATEPPKRPSSAPWRTISLLATPLVLGVINLVDAHFDKVNAITAGDAAYRRLVGEGENAKRLSIDQGYSNGSKLLSGIVKEAENRAAETVAGAKKSAEQAILQGKLKGSLTGRQANVTKGGMEPLHLMGENLLEITKFALLLHEGIEISIDRTNLDAVQYVRRRSMTEAERSEAGRLVLEEAPRLAKQIAVANNYRVDLSLSKYSKSCW